MTEPSPLLFAPEAWDAARLAQQFPWFAALRGCLQDPHHHAEGDVFVHTGMVVAALFALPEWETLPSNARAALYAAALLHDVAKPACTVVDPATGAITSAGHARRGERMARTILAEAALDTDFALTEAVCKLVRLHGLPLWFWEKPDPCRAVIEASLLCDTRLLALLAEADVRGRVCADQTELLDRVALFREYCQENACWGVPRAFPSDHARFAYFRKQGDAASPDYQPYEVPNAFEVTLMAGLPGAGKDTWIKANVLPGSVPVLSLDVLRRERGVAPTDNQSAVVAAAKEQAKTLLRARQPFVWNATNVSRPLRAALVDLFVSYEGARVRLVYVHAPFARVLEQNRRRGVHAVPEPVIRALHARLDVPDLTEAHRVEIVGSRTDSGR